MALPISISSRSSSLQRNHRPTNSTPGYFEFDPSLNDFRPIAMAITSHRASSPAPTNTVRLDAFHVRPSPGFNMPENTSIYAKRALPALPRIATQLNSAPSSHELQSPPSATSFSYPRRPSLYAQGRTATTDCCETSLSTLKAVSFHTRGPSGGHHSHHQRGPSTDSTTSSKLASPCEIDSHESGVRRPRQQRSTSFRNFFNRNTFPGTSIETQQRSTSSMSQSSDISCVDSVLDDPGLCLSKSATPTSTAPSSRRPSTLSLASLRARKTSAEISTVVGVSTKQGAVRKNSASRWNIFAGASSTNEKDEDDEYASPANSFSTNNDSETPAAELSCVRCYYFSARNCNGWIMGGHHGEACDTCTMHGFFGSP